MKRYKKKPIVIEAIQFVGVKENCNEIVKWAIKYDVTIICHNYHDTLSIPTLEGEMVVSVGDWVIKGIRDEFYPCRPDIFEETYDEV